MSEPKETFFFSDEYDRGVEWFGQHFAHCSGEKRVGEASTTTMYTTEAPDRIYEVLGRPELIFVLRDPVERAYSEYLFFVHKGRIPANISFSDVVFRKRSEYSERILEMGCYEKFLGPFVDAFGCEKIEVVLHRDFRESPDSTLEELFRFLGLSQEFRPNELAEHNVTRSPASPTLYYWVRRCWHIVRDVVESRFPEMTEEARQAVRRVLFSEEKPPMNQEARAFLQEFYAESTARLERRLGRDLAHWKE